MFYLYASCQVTFEYNTSIYDASKQQLSIPLLVPMLQYEYQVSFHWVMYVCLSWCACQGVLYLCMLGH